MLVSSFWFTNSKLKHDQDPTKLIVKSEISTLRYQFYT